MSQIHLNTILIDDEQNALDALAFELKEYCKEVRVIGSYTDPHQALIAIKSNKPDLIFLDIKMPGLNGFDLLSQLQDINLYIVFVTAYDQFAIKAFEVNATDYILKPIRITKLVSAVNKITALEAKQFNRERLESLFQTLLQSNHAGLEQIAIPTQEGFKMIVANEIVYLHAESNYTWLWQMDNKKWLITRTLKEMHELLTFEQFFRAHKSYIVNLNHVDKYIRGQGGFLVMKNKTQIPVARNQKNILLEKLHLY